MTGFNFEDALWYLRDFIAKELKGYINDDCLDCVFEYAEALYKSQQIELREIEYPWNERKKFASPTEG